MDDDDDGDDSASLTPTAKLEAKLRYKAAQLKANREARTSGALNAAPPSVVAKSVLKVGMVVADKTEAMKLVNCLFNCFLLFQRFA